MVEDEWRHVKGYEGVYEVSRGGTVRRLVDARTGGHKAGLVMASCRYTNGYVGVCLSKNGKATKRLLHRVVAEAFCESPGLGCTQVNHIDGNKNNNTASNLEWVTSSQNIRHAYDVLGKIGPRGEKCGRAVLTDQKVREIRGLVQSGELHRVVAARYGVSCVQVTRIVNGKRWGHTL